MHHSLTIPEVTKIAQSIGNNIDRRNLRSRRIERLHLCAVVMTWRDSADDSDVIAA